MNIRNNLIVKKLWWENAWKIGVNLINILKDFEKGIPQAIVVSAMRDENFNTTDKLIEIWEYLKDWKKEEALEILSTIKSFHIKLISNNNELKDEEENILHKIEKIFQAEEEKIKNCDLQECIPTKENDYSIKDWENSHSMWRYKWDYWSFEGKIKN